MRKNFTLSLILMIFVNLAIFYWSPPDLAQGMGKRVFMLYLHVPFAWNSFLTTVFAALTSCLYLWKKVENRLLTALYNNSIFHTFEIKNV